MWSIGRFDLQLAEDEFWSLTPVEFHALTGRLSVMKKWGDFRTGIIASTIANVNRGKRKKAYKPADFMPKEESRSGKRTWQDQLAWVEMINAALGGKDLRKKGTGGIKK